jgi:Kdo2-lipid IVA lauroyltransferase/acyltransferase
MQSEPDQSLSQFSSPRYWPVWGVWAGLWLLARLPLSAQLAIGRRLGSMFGRFDTRQRAVAARNLEICFGELSGSERERLLKRHFESVGMSVAEMAVAWFWPTRRLERLIEIHGREHLDRARAGGRGVILLGAHFTTVEIGLRAIEHLCTRASGMYRPQRNAMIDFLIRKGRSRMVERQIPRDDVRRLLRTLRDGYVVVYFPDQTYLGNQSELVPFFGEPAMTNVATTKIAQMSGAAVLPYFFRRVGDGHAYSVDIGPPLEDFPSGDRVADARKFVRRLEDYIRLAPDQYLWSYKKFKGRPAPHRDPYSENDGARPHGRGEAPDHARR